MDGQMDGRMDRLGGGQNGGAETMSQEARGRPPTSLHEAYAALGPRRLFSQTGDQIRAAIASPARAAR